MARIVCVGDSFDAMTSDRAYRPRFTVSKALEEMEKCKGTQFDPDIVDAFMIAMRDNKEQIIKDIGLEY
jgi:HD-GYP domain-containing protein (c-di-GMP phosphodiesterase class II)